MEYTIIPGLQESSEVKSVLEKIKSKAKHYACNINVAVLAESHLIEPNALMQMLCREYETQDLACPSASNKSLKYCYKPLIVIGLEDIRDKETLSLYNYDKRVSFWDSSIWMWYVPLSPTYPLGEGADEYTTAFREYRNAKYSFEGRLTFVVEQICNLSHTKTILANETEHLTNVYETNVAREFLEFQIRLYQNSQLAPVGSGGHATDVAPFKFHSESHMHSMGQDLERFKGISNYRWRLLVLDDYAMENLRIGDEKKGDGTGPTKVEIIRELLDAQGSKDDWVQIEAVRPNGQPEELDFISEFRSMMNQPEDYNESFFDIVLIDYRLGDNQFSTRIFEEFKSKKIKPKYRGPRERTWFFPISVFSFAMMEDFRQAGYTMNDKDWIIARGADPVNTPELFKYSLFKFMEMQLNEVNRFRDDSISSIEPYEPLSIISLFENYFLDGQDIHESAHKNYRKFLRFMHTYTQLQREREAGSLFARSVLAESDTGEIIWDHIHQLMFMLGHEPAYEWPKMWDEMLIIESYLKTKLNLPKDKDPLKNIRDYIIGLQKPGNS